MDHFQIENDFLRAKFIAKGAELCSLTVQGIGEVIWQANPQVWARHAPVLFPIVGKLKNDQYQYNGKTYTLTQHGFARDREFECIYQDRRRIEFLLRDDELTRAHFPFKFELVIAYTLDGEQLHIDYFVRNPSEETIPFGIGAHPGFTWPLVSNVPKSDHWIEFEKHESNAIARLQQGLIATESIRSPLNGDRLDLTADLFANDALIWTQLNSRCVRYHAGKEATLEMRFDHFPHLGIWSKPGADFVCIEPWYGYASPIDFNGEFIDKPGLTRIASNSERMFRHSVMIKRGRN